MLQMCSLLVFCLIGCFASKVLPITFIQIAELPFFKSALAGGAENSLTRI